MAADTKFNWFPRRGPRWGQAWQTAQKIIDTELNDVQREIVKARWLDEAKRWETLWRRQRSAYYSIRVPIIIGAATVPALAGLSVPSVATALVGLFVAILTGLDTMFRLGTRWQQARLAAQAITSEGWQFLELTGTEYEGKERQKAYPLFLRRLEQLNERLAMARLDLFSDEGKGHRQHLATDTAGSNTAAE